jgi:2-dehydropantoate 2-reductase
MGSGGVGGYFGGRLAAAGQDVTFIARGAHLRAMQENGLRIISPLGDAHIESVRATADPGEIGPVDIVLFCVKLYDVEEAAELCKTLIGEDTAVIPLLNGIDAPQRMAPILGVEHIVPGIAKIPSQIAEPGVIEHKAPLAALEFGEADNRESARVTAFNDACASAGIEARISPDIKVALWAKFIMLASFAGVSCMTRQTAGVIRDDPDLVQLSNETIQEIISVALACGIELPGDTYDNTVAMRSAFPADGYPSMWFDLDAGKRMELDGLTGTIVRLGREQGVPTPVNRVIYAALKPFAGGAPG